MRPLGLAYLILIAFFGFERALRRDAAARTLEPGAADRGTTRWIGITCGLSINAALLAPLLNRAGIVRLPRILAVLGPVCMLAGLSVRLWAALTLGKYYTRTLRMAERQPLIQSGPYALVRHPGYAGDMLLWVGFGVSGGNVLVLAAVTAAMAAAYNRRMAAEEAMLVRNGVCGLFAANLAPDTWSVKIVSSRSPQKCVGS